MWGRQGAGVEQWRAGDGDPSVPRPGDGRGQRAAPGPRSLQPHGKRAKSRGELVAFVGEGWRDLEGRGELVAKTKCCWYRESIFDQVEWITAGHGAHACVRVMGLS